MATPPHSSQQTLAQLLARLRTEGRQLPNTLPRAWFSDELFQCRSEYSADYLHEIEDNAHKLAELSPQASSYAYLSQRVEAQLLAYTQAILRARVPKTQRPGSANGNAKRSATNTLTNNTGGSSELGGLQQDLARHHEFERRLQDNLRDAQAQQDHTLIIKCQQRLLRCQRAITAIEKAIEQKTEKRIEK